MGASDNGDEPRRKISALAAVGGATKKRVARPPNISVPFLSKKRNAFLVFSRDCTFRACPVSLRKGARLAVSPRTANPMSPMRASVMAPVMLRQGNPVTVPGLSGAPYPCQDEIYFRIAIGTT